MNISKNLHLKIDQNNKNFLKNYQINTQKKKIKKKKL